MAVGYWIVNISTIEPPFCSKCGEEAIAVSTDTGDVWAMTPYCPWCGSEMYIKHVNSEEDAEQWLS